MLHCRTFLWDCSIQGVCKEGFVFRCARQLHLARLTFHATPHVSQLLYTIESFQKSFSSASVDSNRGTATDYAPGVSSAWPGCSALHGPSSNVLSSFHRMAPLRLLTAAKLMLERLGDVEEAMNLAESAFALMFG